ncbi:hypothetical protein AFERRI_440001 [Acidithiobacillus ferrivorans]|uniref:Uncharacterized protein n=1 Tax=Acidithiobacillus ferrivorans TaxID=160808 RepID=A0A060UWR3_9PROT|nr:hypothetical protein AFERRI_440001 [Acidithiobacillus ferrivorans]
MTLHQLQRAPQNQMHGHTIGCLKLACLLLLGYHLTRFDQPLLCSTACSIHAANPLPSTRYSLHPVVAITPFAHILVMLR